MKKKDTLNIITSLIFAAFFALSAISITFAEDTVILNEETISEKPVSQTAGGRQITADSLRWEYKAKTAIFTGNAIMIAKDGNITADKMTIFFDEKDEIKTITAEGNANLIREKQKCGGEIIEIYPDQNLIILKQSAWISSDKTIFKGEEIRFDTEKEIINITKGVKGEIRTDVDDKSINGGTEAQSSKGTKEEENN